MGKVYDAIDERLQRFIEAQQMFFVASAPRAGGHINLSPKGNPSLRVLGPREVAWLDLIGSGAETIAHLRENGRVALLFCSFDQQPLLLRLHGRGRVLEPGDADFKKFAAHFDAHALTRSIVHVEVERIADSCGFGVPRYRYEGARTQFDAWAKAKDSEGLRRYQLDNNRKSLDGLPALRAATLQSSDEERGDG